MVLARVRLALRIVGWRLALLLTVTVLLYSMASAYIGGTLIETVEFMREEPPAPHGLGLLSVYSGVASTPVTGLLPGDLLARVDNVSGVVYSWGELTTPALVNGSLVVVRGVPSGAWNYTGLRLVEGSLPGTNDYTSVLVGAGLARELMVEPGDLLLIDSIFSRGEGLYRVAGVVEGPAPYRWEIIAPMSVAESLRGFEGVSVARIVYDPARLDSGALRDALGLPGGFERLILHQAIVLVGKGVVELRDPSRLQEYYVERLGVPSEYVLALGVASDALLASLVVALGWLVVGFRRGSLQTLVEEGLTQRGVKRDLVLATLPFIVLGTLAGLYLAGWLPTTRILGYPVTYTPGPLFTLIHTLVFVGLYVAGVAQAGVEG